MEIILAFIAGAVLCGVAAYLKIKNLSSRLEQTAQARTQAELENARLNERIVSLGNAQAGAENFANQLLAQQDKKFAALQATAKAEFKQLAADTLKEQRAELTAKNDEMVSPLKESMDKFTKQVGDLRTESSTHHTRLQDAINRTLELNKNLSQEAQNLTEALKSPKKQGSWGEIILEDVLTTSGFRKGIEFDTQVSITTQDNDRVQPDFVLHLPGNRDFVIDSKMSLTAYMKWQAAATEEEKAVALKEHVLSVEKHIKELSEKDYSALLPHEKMDFVFMFIPIEFAYFLAVQAKPELNEIARKHRVAIVTASNLFSVLQVAENLWRQERASQLIEQIFKTAQEMLDRVGLFTERMGDIHTRITQLTDTYDKADKTLRGSKGIVASAKKLEQLQVKSARKLPQLLEENTAELPLSSSAENN